MTIYDILQNGIIQKKYMLEKIDEEINKAQERLGSGDVKDWEQFTRIRGNIEGYKKIKSYYVLLEVENKRNKHDEATTME